MSILQMYYTSYINKETDSTGFQIKALSSGITPDLQTAILRLIAYRIPPSCDERKPESHPIALRYFYKNKQECILLCSQSNGPDENGRPGNFFAHSLVLEPDSFTSIPPIFYWQSDFWCKEASKTPSEVPSWSSLDIDLKLDIDHVWAFLASSQRKKQFYQLMCAVLYSHKTQRRIVIIDKIDNVALWIAAISCMLPPEYRPLLSFATYHHDPYQAPFLVTGTTSDSFFRALPEEYLTYFILNTEVDKISKVEASPYADRVTQYAHPDSYETQLLPLFSKYARRFPPSTNGINECLDSMILYSDLLTSQQPVKFTSKEEQAVKIALSTFEQLSLYTTEDLTELLHLRQILWTALNAQRTRTLFDLYLRLTTLITHHSKPTEEIVLQELRFFTECLFATDTELSQLVPTIEELQKLYQEELLVICINEPVYLHFLDNLLAQALANQLWQFWQYIGPYLQPGPYSKNVFLKSIELLNKLFISNNFDDENKLFLSIRRTIADQAQEWLAYAIDSKFPKQALEHFYCYYIHPLELDARLSYRRIVQQVVPDIINHELEYDIILTAPKHGLQLFERWSKHLKREHLQTVSLLFSYGLPLLEKRCSSQEWYTLSSQILLSNELKPLPPETQKKLIDFIFSSPSLSTFSRENIKIYSVYHNHQLLSERTRTIIDASLAMVGGQLNANLAQQIHAYLDSLSSEKYLADVEKFIAEFLSLGITDDDHRYMISALFIQKFDKLFWKVYWKNLFAILTYPSQIQRGLDLLSLWFSLSPQRDLSLWQQYIIQNFFLQLPLQLGQLRQSQSFNVLASSINDLARTRKWYPSIQPYLVNNKHISLSTLIPKFHKNQNTYQRTQISKTTIGISIAKLFENENVHKQHATNISLIYSYPQRSQFWTYYWSSLTNLLTRHHDKDSVQRDADLVLSLLSFWFDESFNSLKEIHFVVQDFFLELPRILYEVRKTSQFRELASAINVISAKHREQYRWYTYISNYFMFVLSDPHDPLK